MFRTASNINILRKKKEQWIQYYMITIRFMIEEHNLVNKAIPAVLYDVKNYTRDHIKRFNNGFILKVILYEIYMRI